METATTCHDRHPGGKGTTPPPPPPAYEDWKRARGWRVFHSPISDLKAADRLDFTGNGTHGSGSILKVTHGSASVDWGTECEYDSATDSVTLNHQRPDGTVASLTITRSGGPCILSCKVPATWLDIGPHLPLVDGGSWTAVEG